MLLSMLLMSISIRNILFAGYGFSIFMFSLILMFIAGRLFSFQLFLIKSVLVTFGFINDAISFPEKVVLIITQSYCNLCFCMVCIRPYLDLEDSNSIYSWLPDVFYMMDFVNKNPDIEYNAQWLGVSNAYMIFVFALTLVVYCFANYYRITVISDKEGLL